ncbi:MAG: HEPN domain-containing protein [Cellulomonas sp.]|jgi:hypothetical protein|nr:HEPN domain-containing protein [Cellulomonas sp.]
MTPKADGVVRWEQGRPAVEALLAAGQLTRVQASRDLAVQYLRTARTRLTAVRLIQDEDPAGAFVLTYDAARLALAAILVNQGLRPRGEGAHAVLLEVVLAQTEPPRQQDFREFSWMRRLRNDTQYPDFDRPSATSDDLVQATLAADAIVGRAETLVVHMPPF